MCENEVRYPPEMEDTEKHHELCQNCGKQFWTDSSFNKTCAKCKEKSKVRT